MIKVTGVRFKEAGKVYYFDPGNMDLKEGDCVIVETARGIEFGVVSFDVKLVDESSVVAPLKPVLRLASEEDKVKHEENMAKKENAIKLCQEKIDKHKLEMKLVDVEYTFDGSKIIFYFTADGRVDFRDLVKDLAGVFRMRIELRQIGVRDETKMMGGYGCCGRDLCCHSWLSDFAPVSIKMAKTQNLSLNPLKISGICGRLMCCLQYENDVYNMCRKGMPNVGEHITTPDGRAVVMDVAILENKIKTRLVLEDKSDDKPEKLSSELYTYTKEDIKRDEKFRKENSKREKRKKFNDSDIDLTNMSESELEAQFADE